MRNWVSCGVPVSTTPFGLMSFSAGFDDMFVVAGVKFVWVSFVYRGSVRKVECVARWRKSKSVMVRCERKI